MKFYHGTSEDNWKRIQEEGVLWGERGYGVSRCTYLAIDEKEASNYGSILLEIEYDPFENPEENNYCENCWQVRVYEPIPIENISRIWLQ